MPSKSAKQRRFMAAAANNPKFAKKAGISQSVAREFHEADKQKYQFGGLAMAMPYMQRQMLSRRPQPQQRAMPQTRPGAGGMNRIQPGQFSTQQLMDRVRSGQIRTGGATPSPRMPQRNSMMRGNDMVRPTPEMMARLGRKQVGMAPPGRAVANPGLPNQGAGRMLRPAVMPGGQFIPEGGGLQQAIQGRFGPGAGTRPPMRAMPFRGSPGRPSGPFRAGSPGIGGLGAALQAARPSSGPYKGFSAGRTGITPGRRVNPLAGRSAGPFGGSYSPIRRGARMMRPF